MLHLAVPNYNGDRFLRATLESLNAQGDHLSWWLQDGASTDNSVQIAKKLARPQDTVCSEPDSGQTAAINTALNHCGGEFIGYLNSDDTLLPGAAKTVLQTFADHPEIDLVIGGIEMINAEGKVTSDHFGDIHSLADVLDIYRFWFNKKQWVQPEVFFRRSLFDKLNGFDETLNLAFDYDFWVRAFQQGAKIKYVPQKLAQFRLHPNQKSVQAEQASREVRATAQRVLQAPETSIPKLRKSLMQARLSYDAYARRESSDHNLPFSKMLFRNPLWLFDPFVRQRLKQSLTK